MATTSVTLRPGGVEYVHWTATGLPVDPPIGSIEASIDGGTTWHAATLDGTTVSLLVASPTAVGPDSSAVVATLGGREMLVRLTDTPEVVIRSGGYLITR